jgi:hypothetical protein
MFPLWPNYIDEGENFGQTIWDQIEDREHMVVKGDIEPAPTSTPSIGCPLLLNCG